MQLFSSTGPTINQSLLIFFSGAMPRTGAPVPIDAPVPIGELEREVTRVYGGEQTPAADGAAAPSGPADGGAIAKHLHLEGDTLSAAHRDLVRNNSITEEHEIASAADAEALARKPWYVLGPQTPFYARFWEPVSYVLVLYSCLFVPVFVFFEHFAEEGMAPTERAAVVFVDALFIVDLLTGFVIAYRAAGTNELVVEPARIRRRYLRGWFAIDFVAAFPLGWIMAAAGQSGGEASKLGRMARVGRVLRLLRLARLAKVAKIARVVDSIQRHFELNAGAVRLAKTLFFLLLLTHLVGCTFYGIYNFERGGTDDGWAGANGRYLGAAMENFWGKYLNSLYWAFTTLTTVGYGDISARTNGEIMFSIFTMVLGVTIYSLILSSVNSAMESFDTEAAFREARRLKLTAYTRAAKVMTSAFSFFYLLTTNSSTRFHAPHHAHARRQAAAPPGAAVRRLPRGEAARRRRGVGADDGGRARARAGRPRLRAAHRLHPPHLPPRDRRRPFLCGRGRHGAHVRARAEAAASALRRRLLHRDRGNANQGRHLSRRRRHHAAAPPPPPPTTTPPTPPLPCRRGCRRTAASPQGGCRRRARRA
jgi:hypothetical protein